MPWAVKLLYALRDHLGSAGAVLPRFWNAQRECHIVPDLSFKQFTARLNERQVDYVLLTPGDKHAEKVELLVRGDSEMERIDDLITDWPVGTPVRIYTVSPRHRTAYFSPLVERVTCNRIAVFPPYISVQLLERAVPDRNGVKVLTAKDAFLACAYRAAYMETGCCDWRDADSRCDSCISYEARLRDLSVAAGVSLPEPLTPQSLDQVLSAEGWRPPLDLLEKAARWSPWIQHAFPQLSSDNEESRAPGLAVFFLRQLAFENGWKSEILESLGENGFELLLVQDLDEESRENAARWFRGGDWGAVNLRVSGGPPACVIVGLDLRPRPVTGEVGVNHPELDNMNIRAAKHRTRELINATVPEADAYNPLHSTDNSHQAWTVIRLLLPEQEQDLRGKAAECRRASAINDVGKLTPYRHRAKSYVRHDSGSLAVGQFRRLLRALARRVRQRVLPRLRPHPRVHSSR